MRVWIFLSWLALLRNYCKDEVWGPLKSRIRGLVPSRCGGEGVLTPGSRAGSTPAAIITTWMGGRCMFSRGQGGLHSRPGDPRPQWKRLTGRRHVRG